VVVYLTENLCQIHMMTFGVMGANFIALAPRRRKP